MKDIGSLENSNKLEKKLSIKSLNSLSELLEASINKNEYKQTKIMDSPAFRKKLNSIGGVISLSTRTGDTILETIKLRKSLANVNLENLKDNLTLKKRAIVSLPPPTASSLIVKGITLPIPKITSFALSMSFSFFGNFLSIFSYGLSHLLILGIESMYSYISLQKVGTSPTITSTRLSLMCLQTIFGIGITTIVGLVSHYWWAAVIAANVNSAIFFVIDLVSKAIIHHFDLKVEEEIELRALPYRTPKL